MTIQAPLYDSSFVCSESRKWVIKFTVKQVKKFCGEFNLSLDKFSYFTLNFEQHCRLIWMGIAHHQDSKRYEDEDDFMEECLDGDKLEEALEKLSLAVFNFTLPRLKDQKAKVKTIELINTMVLGIDNEEKTVEAKASEEQTPQDGSIKTT